MKVTAKNLDRALHADDDDFDDMDDLIQEDELVGGRTKMKTHEGQQKKRDINIYNNVVDPKRETKKPKF